jgi:uncharacterized alpha-E superfamily protein
MLSRIAQNLYWMGRYLERAHNSSRLIGINLNYLLEVEDSLTEEAQWTPLLEIGGSAAEYAEVFADGKVTAERVVEFLTREASYSNSVWNCLRLARENARIVRDRISKEMWEAMNEFWLEVDEQLRKPLPLRAWPEFHKFVRNGVALFNGLASSTMMRGESYSFYQVGVEIERADMTARILDVKYHLLLPDLSLVGSALDYYQWAALLKSISGFEAYRRKVHAGFQPIDVAEFIIFEPEFPRSLRYAIEALYDDLKVLGANMTEHDSLVIMSRLLDEWSDTPIQEIFNEIGLHEFLQKFLRTISELHVALTQDFFTCHVGF